MGWRRMLAAAIAVGSTLVAAPAAMAAMPVVAASNPLDVTPTGATLYGTVDPDGSATNYHFEWDVAGSDFCAGVHLAEGTAVVVNDRGFIEVDDVCRTAEPGVYAVGDVIPTPALAHVGFVEGITVVKDILGEDPVGVDYANVPWCIYCYPEVAFAGHSQQSAEAAGLDVVVSAHRYIGNGRALILGEPDGMVKIIAEKRSDGTAGRILGVHMVGPWVTEQLGQGYLAVNWEATVDEVAQFIQPHPTLSELFGESVLALTGRSLHG